MLYSDKNMPKAVCPKCGLNFDATSQRTYRGIEHDLKMQVHNVYKTPEAWIDESAQVNCPRCNEVFTSKAVKFFGILNPKGLKIFIGLFMAGFLAFAIYALLKSF